MKTHNLKTLPVHFKEVYAYNKTGELRFNDRDFKLGDFLILEEWDSVSLYSGRRVQAMITHVLTSEEFQGLKEGFVLLSMSGLKRISDDSETCY